MRKEILLFIIFLNSASSFCQMKIRPIEQLINRSDPGWKLVKEWIDSAKNKVEILPADTMKGNQALWI